MAAKRSQSAMLNGQYWVFKQGVNETGSAKKTYANETKLGGNAKNKEQKEGVRQAEEMLALNHRHFTECPQTCRTPLGR